MDTFIKSTAINLVRKSAPGMKASSLQRQSFQLLFTCLLIVTVVTMTAVAQGTSGGPTIFNQDETMIPNAVRYAVMFLFGIAFLFGAGSVVWGVMAYTRRQECMNWIIGGGLCMVVGGVVAGVAYLAGGNQLDVPNDLSGSLYQIVVTARALA